MAKYQIENNGSQQVKPCESLFQVLKTKPLNIGAGVSKFIGKGFLPILEAVTVNDELEWAWKSLYLKEFNDPKNRHSLSVVNAKPVILSKRHQACVDLVQALMDQHPEQKVVISKDYINLKHMRRTLFETQYRSGFTRCKVSLVRDKLNQLALSTLNREVAHTQSVTNVVVHCLRCCHCGTRHDNLEVRIHKRSGPIVYCPQVNKKVELNNSVDNHSLHSLHTMLHSSKYVVVKGDGKEYGL